MMNKVSKNKFVLPLILIFLLITLPLGIIGMINHNKDEYIASNPNKEHKYNGQLFYYDDAGNLLGVYKCKADDCTDVSTKITDEYLAITPGNEDTIAYAGDRMAFVSEGGEIKAISFISEAFERVFYEVKNYGDNSLPFIVVKTDEGLYSAVSSYTIGYVIPQIYDYVGFVNNDNTNGYFSVMKNNRFYIIQSNGPEEEKMLSTSFSNPIYYYTSNLIVLSNNGNLGLYTYDGNILENDIKKIGFLNNSIAIKTSYDKVYVYFTKDDIRRFDEGNNTYDFEITTEGIDIKSNNEVIETINE